MKITVLFPTNTEASQFHRDDVTSIISGVGLTATTLSTIYAIQKNTSDVLILAGIAGKFFHSELKINDVVLVESELEGDFGFFTKSGFMHMAHLPIDMDFERRHTLLCPHIPQGLPFPLVRGMSVNAAIAPFVDTREADIENMEGAAFFYTCLIENQKFLELRAISNLVSLDDTDWDMEQSVAALTKGLHQLIDHLQSQSVNK
mgnify:CR=1 FL=1